MREILGIRIGNFRQQKPQRRKRGDIDLGSIPITDRRARQTVEHP